MSMRFVFVCFLGLAAPAAAREPLTENTFTFADEAAMPLAGIEDAAWLAGPWLGEGLGAVSEEVWSAPRAGTMMGTYRLVKDDVVAFYEIMIIAEENDSLVLRLKHFDADLVGWEEREQMEAFALVDFDENALYFDGLTYRRLGADTVHVYMAMEQDDGSVEEALFVHRRVE